MSDQQSLKNDPPSTGIRAGIAPVEASEASITRSIASAVTNPFSAIRYLTRSSASFEDLKPGLDATFGGKSHAEISRFSDIISGATDAIYFALPFVAVGKINLCDRYDQLKKLDDYLHALLKNLDSQDCYITPS